MNIQYLNDLEVDGIVGGATAIEAGLVTVQDLGDSGIISGELVRFITLTLEGLPLVPSEDPPE